MVPVSENISKSRFLTRSPKHEPIISVQWVSEWKLRVSEMGECELRMDWDSTMKLLGKTRINEAMGKRGLSGLTVDEVLVQTVRGAGKRS